MRETTRVMALNRVRSLRSYVMAMRSRSFSPPNTTSMRFLWPQSNMSCGRDSLRLRFTVDMPVDSVSFFGGRDQRHV